MKKILLHIIVPMLVAQISLGIICIWAYTQQVLTLSGTAILYTAGELVFAALFYVIYYRAVSRPLAALKKAIHHMLDQKDLASHVPISGAKGIADLLKMFNQIIQAFDETLVNVSASTARLEPMSRELADTNMGLSQRNIIQKNHNESIAQSLNQVEQSSISMSSAVGEIMTVTETSNGTIRDSVDSVNRSYQVIHRLADETEAAVTISTKLHDSSREIGDVVNMINTIAEQTNLLALNAAIEAARAGEAGRGFAVVADEVRNLSIKTQESTLKIEEMIQVIQTDVDNVMRTMSDSQEASKNSVSTIDQVKKQFDLIHQQIDQITQKSYGIHAAIDEQRKLITQVIEENNEMNVINDDIVKFTKESAISENDLIGLGSYISKYLRTFSLSQTEFDTSMREKKKIADNDDTKKADDDDIELF